MTEAEDNINPDDPGILFLPHATDEDIRKLIKEFNKGGMLQTKIEESNEQMIKDEQERNS